MEPTTPRHVENSTDASHGEPLAARARTRKAELEKALALLIDQASLARTDIEIALAEVDQWLAGDADHPSHMTGEDLDRWLERTKHLAAPKA